MRLLWLTFLTLITLGTHAQGQLNVSLLDQWSDDNLVTSSTTVRYNECWGFEYEGEEYAVLGSTEGTHFFRLTESDQFEFIDSIQGRFANPQVVHRDFAVFQDYLYSVCDEGESSLQIIDLSGLPNTVSLAAEDDTTFARVHNVYVDTATALLYACIITPKVNGTLQGARSMQVFSLANPTAPTLVYSGPNDIPEVHDVYVRDNLAYLNCGNDGLRVYDFSTPNSPTFIQNLNFYQDQGYNHQGWMSEDGSTYVFGDETNGARLKRCSVANGQVTIGPLFGTNWENNSVPHNVMIRDGFVFVAYYNEGLRIFDLKSVVPTEIAHYDTYPIEETIQTMRGAWGIYAHYASGRILVSDRIHGLFLFDFPTEVFSNSAQEAMEIFPNPIVSGTPFFVRMKDSDIKAFHIQVIDSDGRILYEEEVENQNFVIINKNLGIGQRTVRVLYTDYLNEEQKETRSIILH